jgi:hypothetical protein
MQRKFNGRWAAVPALCVALSGCGAEGYSDSGNEASRGATRSELNGGVDFEDSSCRGFESKIRDGFTLANSMLWLPVMTECLESAVMSASTRFAEYTLAELRYDVRTKVNCQQLSEGNAEGSIGLGVNRERITFDPDHVRDSTPTKLANTIIHEVTHNKGYRHARTANNSPGLQYINTHEYTSTVPLQTEACARSIGNNQNPVRPFGQRRALMGTEATLAPFGSIGGAPFQLRCPLPAKGVQVQAGDVIDAIGLSCLGFVEPIERTHLVGGFGGTYTAMDCGAGEVLVGVHGTAENVVMGLGAICASLSSVQARRRTPADIREVGWRGDGLGGMLFRRWCPAGMAVSGLRGRVGALVDRVEVECMDVSRLNFGGETELNPHGGNDGTVYLEKCAGRGALIGITTQYGDYVDRMGGVCDVVSTTCTSGSCTEALMNLTYVLPSYGGFGGGVAEQKCRSGSVVVGVEVHAGDLIDAISPICAEAVAWSSTSGAAPTVGYPRMGGGGGQTFIETCSRGSFMTGWNIRANSNTVTGVRPICRNFQ